MGRREISTVEECRDDFHGPKGGLKLTHGSAAGEPRLGNRSGNIEPRISRMGTDNSGVILRRAPETPLRRDKSALIPAFPLGEGEGFGRLG
jgi:hypothetical protein